MTTNIVREYDGARPPLKRKVQGCGHQWHDVVSHSCDDHLASGTCVCACGAAAHREETGT
jgi:hypothetical protein